MEPRAVNTVFTAGLHGLRAAGGRQTVSVLADSGNRVDLSAVAGWAA